MRLNQYVLYYLILLLTVPITVSASGNPLKIGGQTLVWGSSCDPGEFKLIAGSPFILSIINKDDQPAEVRERGWPEGYVIETALDLPAGRPFIEEPGLTETLQPYPYLSVLNLMYEKWLQSDSPYVNLMSLNTKYFAVQISSELAGHTVSFRARYRHQGIESVSIPAGPFYIIAPCNRDDTARIAAVRVYEAWHRGDNRLAVEIADTMLLQDLLDATGLWLAGSAANSIGDVEKELLFLDRLYQEYGVVAVELGTAEPPQRNADKMPDPRIEQNYQQRRATLLQRIQQQR